MAEISDRLIRTADITGALNKMFEGSVQRRRELTRDEIDLLFATMRTLQTELERVLDPEIEKKMCGNCGQRRLVRATSNNRPK